MYLHYLVSVKAGSLAEAVSKLYPSGAAFIGQPELVPNGGAGTELKKLLAGFGIKPGAGCNCEQHIFDMDSGGIERCERNIEDIVRWLREEAQRAGLPFTKIGARLLVKRAIHNAKKNQQKDHDMLTVKLIINVDTDDIYKALESTKPKVGTVVAGSAEPTQRPVSQQSTQAPEQVPAAPSKALEQQLRKGKK
jgi:hypothetical protein